jgi:histidinol phosphatase-like PHP family hydrolase
MKIDFHIHTSEYSETAKSTAKQQVEAAIKKGLDAIFITDHQKLFPQERIDELNEEYAPFKIYQGIEITLKGEENESFVVLGVHDKRLEEEDWKYEDLHKFVHEKKGATILVHPYRFSDQVNVDIWEYPPDAVEVLSKFCGKKNYERRKRLASVVSKPEVTNSDSHEATDIGRFYNVFPVNCDSEELILHSLLDGTFFVKEI